MSHREEIKNRLAELSHRDSVDESLAIRDLGLDSLDVVETLLELEEKYSVAFDDIDMSKLVTVKDLLDAIESKLK